MKKKLDDFLYYVGCVADFLVVTAGILVPLGFLVYFACKTH